MRTLHDDKRRTNEMRMNDDIFLFSANLSEIYSIYDSRTALLIDTSSICSHSCAKIFHIILAQRCVLDENSITAPFLIFLHTFDSLLLISIIRYSLNVTEFQQKSSELNPRKEKFRVSIRKQSMHGRIKNYINCVISYFVRSERHTSEKKNRAAT